MRQSSILMNPLSTNRQKIHSLYSSNNSIIACLNKLGCIKIHLTDFVLLTPKYQKLTMLWSDYKIIQGRKTKKNDEQNPSQPNNTDMRAGIHNRRLLRKNNYPTTWKMWKNDLWKLPCDSSSVKSSPTYCWADRDRTQNKSM